MTDWKRHLERHPNGGWLHADQLREIRAGLKFCRDAGDPGDHDMIEVLTKSYELAADEAHRCRIAFLDTLATHAMPLVASMDCSVQERAARAYDFAEAMLAESKKRKDRTE